MYNVYRCIPNFQTKPGETLLRPGDSQREVGHFLTDRISWDHICYWEWKPCVAVQGINLYVKVVPWRLRMPARIVFGKEKHMKPCTVEPAWQPCHDHSVLIKDDSCSLALGHVWAIPKLVRCIITRYGRTTNSISSQVKVSSVRSLNSLRGGFWTDSIFHPYVTITEQ